MSVVQKPPCRHYREVKSALKEITGVLTHWDADGILVGNKLLEFLKEKYVTVYIPRIGSWSLEAVPEEVNLEPKIAILDYGFPNMDQLKPEIVIIDHHMTPAPPNAMVCNPPLEGGWAPSATFVLSSILGQFDWRDAVSVAADLVEPEKWEGWERLSQEVGVSLEEAKEAATILNSCYRLGDVHCIQSLTHSIHKLGLQGILESTSLRQRVEKVRKILDELERKVICSENDNIMTCEVDVDDKRLIMVSALWRRLNKRINAKEMILIMKGNEFARVYCRGEVLDHPKLIERLRDITLEVGGKKEVCSALLKKSELENVLNVLTKAIT